MHTYLCAAGVCNAFTWFPTPLPTHVCCRWFSSSDLIVIPFFYPSPTIPLLYYVPCLCRARAFAAHIRVPFALFSLLPAAHCMRRAFLSLPIPPLIPRFHRTPLPPPIHIFYHTPPRTARMRFSTYLLLLYLPPHRLTTHTHLLLHLRATSSTPNKTNTAALCCLFCLP